MAASTIAYPDGSGSALGWTCSRCNGYVFNGSSHICFSPITQFSPPSTREDRIEEMAEAFHRALIRRFGARKQ